MDEKYTCYCGLYCGNCAVKVKIRPAAEALEDEMQKAGFDEIIQYIPGGEEFWSFLKGMSEKGLCISCRDWGGNPGCEVRICAKKKDIKMCALCKRYPCEKFDAFFENYPTLKDDNELLRKKGWDAWEKLQDERILKSYSYSDEKKA